MSYTFCISQWTQSIADLLISQGLGLHSNHSNLFKAGPPWFGCLVIFWLFCTIGLASDDVKLVLNNNSVPGYGHTHVHKDWKILCGTQALSPSAQAPNCNFTLPPTVNKQTTFSIDRESYSDAIFTCWQVWSAAVWEKREGSFEPRGRRSSCRGNRKTTAGNR